MVLLPKLDCQPVVDNHIDLHDNNSRVMCATSTIGLGTIEPTCAGSQRAPPSDVGAYLIPTTLSPPQPHVYCGPCPWLHLGFGAL